MVQYPGADLPHFGPESRMVRDSRVEPSTVDADIEDGSILQDRTFHAKGRYHGQFGIQELNLPR